MTNKGRPINLSGTIEDKVSSSFISGVKRTDFTQGNEVPGPGSYRFDENKSEIRNGMNFSTAPKRETVMFALRDQTKARP